MEGTLADGFPLVQQAAEKGPPTIWAGTRRRWLTRALVAAYLEYAWTHLRWVPRGGCPSVRMGDAALDLDLFEQPDKTILSAWCHSRG